MDAPLWLAAALVGSLAAIVSAAWLAVAWRLRGPQDTFPLWMLRTLNWVYCRLWFRLRPPARDPLPAEGPFLLLSNHTCAADPFLITACTRRTVSFLMAAEFFDLAALRWIFRAVDAIAVTRSGQDLAAVREALRALAQGRPVGVFPEGRIGPPEGMLPGRLGAALIARWAGVPVIPVYVAGPPRTNRVAHALLRGGHKQVRFGRPIRPEDWPAGVTPRERLIALTDLFMARIAALDPAGRQGHPGVVAGAAFKSGPPQATMACKKEATDRS